MTRGRTLVCAGDEAAGVLLAEGLARELLGQARVALPHEACGVLLGRPGPPPELLCSVHARNVDPRPHLRFELDPGALVAAEDRARAAGLEVLGIWHSHPAGPAVPSDEDRAGAFGGWRQIIVAPASVPAELRCWRLVQGRLREELLSTPRGRRARTSPPTGRPHC